MLARRLADERVAGVSSVFLSPITMTAISRPVSRGVMPALAGLAERGLIAAGDVDRLGFQRRALSAGIQNVALFSIQETTALTGNSPVFSAYLLSDMLLVEGLLRATGGEYLNVAEFDFTNLPGLLADDHAFGWVPHYTCYLDRLRSLGIKAYWSDPATCP